MTNLELSRLVTERVFQSCDPHRVFSYADNLNDAQRIIERLREIGFVVRIDNGLDGTWEVTFYNPRAGGDQFYAPEDTLPRAICVSALWAVNAPELTTQPKGQRNE